MTSGNDNLGQHGKWVTWFYPDTGKYAQDFTPDTPAVMPAPTPQFTQQPAAPPPAQQFTQQPAAQTPQQQFAQQPAPGQQFAPQQFAAQYAPSGGYTAQPQPENNATSKKTSLVYIIMPMAALIIGVLIAFIQYR